MLILVVVMLVAFLVTVTFSVEIAYMHLARAELRSATDAAAQAASQELSRTLDPELAIAKGQEIAEANLVSGKALQLGSEDFQFGRSELDDSGRFVFREGLVPQNTVRVLGRRTADSASGGIPLLFGNMLGVDSFQPQLAAAATYIERDVVLVVDRSGSMRGSKWNQLRSAIDVFIETLSSTPVDEQVGLASYNARATEDVALTDDLNSIARGLNALSTGGRTSISRGMEAGAAIIERGRNRKFVERTLIVMTDGQHNEGVEPRDVATRLAEENVQLHTITFGSGADQNRMREVAAIGGGRHFHALTADELADAYREIALTLGTVITE